MMTGRGLFRMVAALVLVAVPVPGGPSLRGEDDTVVDAATKRAQEQGQQQQQVVLDQQMNGMFFPVEGNAEKSRQQCLDRLLLQVSALDEICGLKAEQRRKCEAAAPPGARGFSRTTWIKSWGGRQSPMVTMPGPVKWSGILLVAVESLPP